MPILDDVGPKIEWFSLSLRLAMGWVFFTAGLSKLLGGFSAEGYLANIAPASPLSGLYGAMAANPAMLAGVDFAIPIGQVLIGVGLLVGGLVRLAALFGAIQSLAFYFGNWELVGAYDILTGFVTSELIYALAFLTIAAMGAGRYYGIDGLIEDYETDGTSLVDRYPKLRYVLG